MRPAAPACLHRQVLARAVLTAPGAPGLTYHAAGRPAGPAISLAALITGTARTRGTSTVTVTGAPAPGASVATTSVWTISPPRVPRPDPRSRKGQP
jgi:hypothetical protein